MFDGYSSSYIHRKRIPYRWASAFNTELLKIESCAGTSIILRKPSVMVMDIRAERKESIKVGRQHTMMIPEHKQSYLQFSNIT
jgi:hypothetical protein